MAAASPPFLAFAADTSDQQTLSAFAQAQGFGSNCVYQGTIREAAQYLKDNPSPQLLVVEIPSRDEASALLDSLADVVDPDTKVIAIGSVNEYSYYCWLMDIGLFAYLLKPLTAEMLESTYHKSKAPAGGAKTEKPPAKLIAVMGARGGVGATTLAVNLASVLAELTHKNTALVDLDPQEGSVALSLDIEPSRGLRDALEKPDRIDSLFLDRVMSKVGKHLSVLSAEESIADRIAASDTAADPMLKELRTKYDYVVLDIPRHMNAFTHACLRQADHAFLVTELSLLCLRDTLRMQDAMREVWKLKPPTVVASRVGMASKMEVPSMDFEKGANCKIAAKIPFAPEIYMALERDVPAMKHKNHASVRAIYELAATIAPQAKTVPVKEAKPGFSLFKKKG